MGCSSPVKRLSWIDRGKTSFHSPPTNSIHRCKMDRRPVSCNQSETRMLASDWLQLTDLCCVAAEQTTIDILCQIVNYSVYVQSSSSINMF